MSRPHGAEMNWERETVECVVCPDCAFTFDACHTDEDGSYSCPACGELRLLAFRRLLKSEASGVGKEPEAWAA